MTNREININVPVLVRVEGEGALELHISGQQIQNLKLRIYEPPRLFEKFLEGRDYFEVPDIVPRICGICPVAYQMSAVHAIEQIFQCNPGAWVRSMRRVIYCGEWIQSHSLHIHLLAAPDFVGYNSAVEMARDYPDEVRRGLLLQSVGNDLMRLMGARSVHPVGVRVGGFSRAPSSADIVQMLDKLHNALPHAEALIAWTAALNLPKDNQIFDCVSLRHANEYPMNEGRIVSTADMDIDKAEFETHFQEFQVPHSTALHALSNGRPYLVGPLSRLNNNLDRLPAPVVEALNKSGISFPSFNMFHSIVARAAEIYFSLLEAIKLLQEAGTSDCPHVETQPGSGVGFGCTEAPRGLLWHRYELNETGNVVSAKIVPPTSQNQARIEEDLRTSLQNYGLDHSDDELRLHGEKVIRNYDPCISCSTHFLKLKVQR